MHYQTDYRWADLFAACLVAFIMPVYVFAQQGDSIIFGSKTWISNGLQGRIFFLPQNTRALPDFDTLKAVDTIYTPAINIAPRSWSAGFPGLPDRFEWFGIEYTGTFRTAKPGHYVFKLLSDDGSKLFIDGQLIVDNDKLHSVAVKTGEADLDNSDHTIKLQYFQGPRFQIALQLFASLQNEKAEIFPGSNFILSTPHQSNEMVWLWWMSGGVLLMVIVLLLRRRRKKRITSDTATA